MINKQRLQAAAAEMGIALDAQQLDLLARYSEAVLEKNKVMNLTAIVEPEPFEIKHLLDSLTAAALPEVAGNVLDVGAGAGFPGVVAKIYKPEITLTLLDATAKKMAFVGQACADLGIAVTTLHARAEQLAREAGYREQYSCVLARAVAGLPTLLEYCLPFVKPGGHFVALKGADTEIGSALAALKALGGEVSEIKKLTLPDGSLRRLVVVKKISRTSPQYPRHSKQIAKKHIM